MYETVPLGANLQKLPGTYVVSPGLPSGVADVITAEDYRARYIPAARSMRIDTMARATAMGIPIGADDNILVNPVTPALFFRLNPRAPRGGQQVALGDYFTTEDVDGSTILEDATLGIPLSAEPVVMASRGSGLGGFLDSVLNTLGFRDPIAADYPGMTDAQAYAAVKADVDLAVSKLPGLRSAGTQASLARKLFPIRDGLANLGAAFSGDGQVGKRERDKLQELVLANDAYTKDWRDAKRSYGYQDPVTGETEGPAAASPAPQAPMMPSMSIPQDSTLLWIAGGAIAILGLAALKKRKKKSA